LTDIDDEKFDEELLNPTEPEEAEEVEAEVVETFPAVTEQPQVPLNEKKGFISLKKRTIAELAEQGYGSTYIAKQVHLSPNRVYRLLNNDQEIADEIVRIRAAKYKKADETMVDLLLRAMEDLREDLLSPDSTRRVTARNRILDLFKEMRKGTQGPVPEGGVSPTVVQQFFGQNAQGQGGAAIRPTAIDDIIIRKSKERGLKIPKVEKKKIKKKEEEEGEGENY